MSKRIWSFPAPVDPCDLHRGDRLLGALGRHRQRIDFAPQHVALDEIAHEAVEDLRPRVHFVMLDGTDGERLRPDRRALGGGGAARIHEDGMHRPPRVSEAGDAVGGVESARKGQGECST